jgi:hypothetical protein
VATTIATSTRATEAEILTQIGVLRSQPPVGRPAGSSEVLCGDVVDAMSSFSLWLPREPEDDPSLEEIQHLGLLGHRERIPNTRLAAGERQ